MMDFKWKISTFLTETLLSPKDDDYCGVINAESNGKREGEWSKTKCSKECFFNNEIGIL